MSKVGFVKQWNEERGFGHIGQEGGQNDIFVHRTCLIGANSLKANDRVFYDAIYDDRKQKFQAISCRIINDVPRDPTMVPHTHPHNGQFHAQPQPMPVHMMQSPNGITPMSSPGTPPHMQAHPGMMVAHGGYATPPGQQPHFVPNNFMRQGTGFHANSPGQHMPLQQSPSEHGPSPGAHMQQFW